MGEENGYDGFPGRADVASTYWLMRVFDIPNGPVILVKLPFT